MLLITLRRVASRSHGDRTVRFLHGEDIVHAVARHGNGMPRRFERLNEQRFLFGRNSAENIVFRSDVYHFAVAHAVKGDVAVGAFHARAAGDLGNGHRVIARNDFDRNVVFLEPVDRLDRVSSHVVRQGDQGEGL